MSRPTSAAYLRRFCSSIRKALGILKVWPKPHSSIFVCISWRAFSSVSSGFFKFTTKATLSGFLKRMSSSSNAGSNRLRSARLSASTQASKSPSTQSRCVATTSRRKKLALPRHDFFACNVEASLRMICLPVYWENNSRL